MLSAKKLCYTAILTALTAVLCSFSVPTPVGAHIYLVDAAVFFAGFVLDPLSAFIAGGIGAMIGDAIFYPVATFVSLFTHGVQAVVVSLLCGGFRRFSDKTAKGALKGQILPVWWRLILALIAGCAVMVGGYALGTAYVYGGGWARWDIAIPKMPFELLQAAVGAVLAAFATYATPLRKVFFAAKSNKGKTEKKEEKGE